MTTFFVVYFLFGIVWFLLCFPVASTAKRKGRSYGGFFWLSFFFTPILGAIVVAILSPVTPSARLNVDASNPNRATLAGEELLKCPKCAEFIKAEAKVCRFCQSDVSAYASDMAAKLAEAKKAEAAAEQAWLADYEQNLQDKFDAQKAAQAEAAQKRKTFFQKPVVRILVGLIIAGLIAGAGFALYSKIQADGKEQDRQATWGTGSPSPIQQWQQVLQKCAAPSDWLKGKTVKLPEGTMERIRDSTYKHLILWYPNFPEGCVYFSLVGNKGTIAGAEFVQIAKDDTITWTPDWSLKIVEENQSKNYPFVYKALVAGVDCVTPLLAVDTDFTNTESVTIFPDSASAELSLAKGHSRNESLDSLLTKRAKCFVETFAPIESFTKGKTQDGLIEWVSIVQNSGTSWEVSVFENPNDPLVSIGFDVRKH